jgi:Tfp pilus assembly protein PilO
MLKDKLIKSSRSSKIIVSIAIVAIVSMAAYNWVVSPMTAYLHASQLHETVMNSARQRAVRIESQMSIKQEELEKAEREMFYTQSGFFTTTRAKEFFLDLEPISVETGCDVLSFEFVTNKRKRKGDASNSYGIIAKSAEIGFTGGYDNIIKFLKKLGSCPERFSINKINIESAGDNQSAGLMCQMTVTVYTLQEKEITVDE